MSTAPILSADNLTRHYPVKRGMFGGEAVVKALHGVGFTLEAGKTLAIVGESGCGKSTLARLITMIEEPTAGGFSIDGVPVVLGGKPPKPALRRKVQIIFQDPYGSLNPRQKISTLLEEPLKLNTSMSAAERRQAGLAMMDKVGLRPELYDRYPHMFSGGQRQRIAIARALMLRPEILVLDEPVSALDLSIQAQILNLLADLRREFNLAYIFISHDLSVVKYIADEVMVMYLGRAVEFGPREAVFSDPQHPYTKALFSATPVADPHQPRRSIRLQGELPSPIDPPGGCTFHPRCPLCFDRCRTEEPQMRPVPSGMAACHAIETA
ncbi:MAG: dipeptide ABC transporter ATP-binding protein [Hyphomicrobiales bacterium]|nr:MAG: dipeptide ABC transporter ATP-binding protein [Hyphomicrobiales bacterium]